MSSLPDLWKELIAAFENNAAQLGASAAAENDESARQKLLDAASQYDQARVNLSQIYDDEVRLAAKDQEEKAKVQAAASVEPKPVSTIRKVGKSTGSTAPPQPLANAKSKPEFDPKLGERLKRTLFARMSIGTARLPPLTKSMENELVDWVQHSSDPGGSRIPIPTSATPEQPFGPAPVGLPPVSQRHQEFRDQLISLASRLPRREAIWWSILMAAHLVGAEEVETVFARIPVAHAAYDWVCDPTMSNAKRVEEVPCPDLSLPAGCVARAIRWLGVSAKMNFDLDNPTTTSEAVVRAIILMADMPGSANVEPRAFLALALLQGEEILHGRSLWDQSLHVAKVNPSDPNWDEWISDRFQDGP